MTELLTTEELLEKRVRDSAPLVERLEEIRRRVGDMCANRHGPKMTIPVAWYDDDFFIATTIKDAIEALVQPPTTDQPLGYLHEITEPSNETIRLYSSSDHNPWSHWLALHSEKCKYHCTPLYAHLASPAAPSTADRFIDWLLTEDGMNAMRQARESVADTLQRLSRGAQIDWQKLYEPYHAFQTKTSHCVHGVSLDSPGVCRYCYNKGEDDGK